MIVVTDVHYHDGGGARAAAVAAATWTSATAARTWTVDIAEVASYEPGAFYRRELPCLLALLAVADAPDCVVVDGHAWLDDRPGLGAHLHEATGLPVIGVAKRHYRGGRAAPVIRASGSRSPLYVSTAGFPLDEACRLVLAMHGDHRLPTLLKRVDRLCRDGR